MVLGMVVILTVCYCFSRHPQRVSYTYRPIPLYTDTRYHRTELYKKKTSRKFEFTSWSDMIQNKHSYFSHEIIRNYTFMLFGNIYNNYKMLTCTM